MTDSQPSKWRDRLPLIAVVAVAAIGAFALRDYLSFESLRDNREALLAFRDDNYALTALAFVLAYIAIVAFSLPGATPATLTGGFFVRAVSRRSVQCGGGDHRGGADLSGSAHRSGPRAGRKDRRQRRARQNV